MKQDRIEAAVWSCYRELYRNAEPKADFDELVANATINRDGRKEIPFRDYIIDDSSMDAIIAATLKDFRIPKHIHGAFKSTIYLGCSPCSRKKME